LDALSSEAVESLNSAIEATLPDAPPELRSSTVVHPLSVVPTGLGGFVAINEEPRGEVFGRRVTATVLVTARSEELAGLDEAAAAVSRVLVSAADSRHGINRFLEISLSQLGSKRPPEGHGANRTMAEQDLHFNIRYEFLKLPAAGAAHEIETTPIALDVALSDEEFDRRKT
jgi:hypothetical protein